MAGEPPIWVLLGQRTGDNNQLLRLATELGRPFRALELRYNSLHLVPPRLLGATLASLDRASRQQIAPPWPELVLGIGHRSVPVALAIRRLSGNRTRLVRLGNPRRDPRDFSLVITTPQYRVPDASNVIRLPIGISTARKVKRTREEAEWLDRLPRPRRLLLIGGDTFMWSLDPDRIARAATTLKQKAERDGGSIIAVSSARSGKAVLEAVAAALRDSRHGLVWGRFPRYPVLLSNSDEIYVTADSVAMVSDAVATSKPVGLIMPGKTASGRFFYGMTKFGVTVPVRDIRRFSASIRDQRLGGTVEGPVAGKLKVDPLGAAVSAIRKLLG